jgi:NAD(P) transhydrogenase subunit alpha
MIIGIPSEVLVSESRLAATPQTVKRLLKQGFEVVIQSKAGEKANFSDLQFQNAGAQIVNDALDVYNKAAIILKVNEPTFKEVEMMVSGTVLLSLLRPGQNQELLQKLADKDISALAMDAIPRISRAQKVDVLSSMANIAGYRSVIEAAFYFGRFLNGQITAAGKVEPAKVLVIGAGVAGLAAIGAANSLGAIVRAFDTRKEVAEQIQSMGAQFLTVDINEDGATDSGYSKEMSEEFIAAEMALFKAQAADVDIIITTAQIPGREAPKLILESHVAVMKPGSVIVDLAASSGGNCALTKDGEIFTTENGVTIIGKLNQLPAQSSQLFGNNLCHMLDDMGKAENWNINMEDTIISRAMVTHNGRVNWPPEPLPVSTIKPQVLDSSQVQQADITKNKNKNKSLAMIIKLGSIGLFLFGLGQFAPAEFMQHFTVFVLAVFIGWQVIWNVAHSLHTPLMAVTNAISGIIVVGGLLQTKDSLSLSGVLAFTAIFFACINIVGGFFVTQRMLKMFKK